MKSRLIDGNKVTNTSFTSDESVEFKFNNSFMDSHNVPLVNTCPDSMNALQNSIRVKTLILR